MSADTQTWLINILVNAVIIVCFVLILAKACINVATNILKMTEDTRKARQERNQELARLEKLKALKWKK